MSQLDQTVGHTHIALTAEIVSAYVANNPLRVSELPTFIAATHAALTGLTPSAAGPTTQKAIPAQIRKSITPAGLVSFIDGRSYKTLKRHIAGHGFTPESYRSRYGLPVDYPMVAASYSEARSALAKGFGLGNQRRRHVAAEPVAPVEEPPAKPKRRGRSKAKATEA